MLVDSRPAEGEAVSMRQPFPGAAAAEEAGTSADAAG